MKLPHKQRNLYCHHNPKRKQTNNQNKLQPIAYHKCNKKRTGEWKEMQEQLL
jgi:hypothetical protein